MTRARRSLQYVLAASCALLALLLAYELSAPLPDFAPPSYRLKPRAQPLPHAAAVATPPPEAFAEIATRPLFDPSRKGALPAAAGDAPLGPPDVTLVGVILDGGDSLALLRTAAAPLATAYRVGATVSGWQVTEISPDRVVLGAGPARSEIRLEANKAPPRPPAAPPSNSQ